MQDGLKLFIIQMCRPHMKFKCTLFCSFYFRHKHFCYVNTNESLSFNHFQSVKLLLLSQWASRVEFSIKFEIEIAHCAAQFLFDWLQNNFKLSRDHDMTCFIQFMNFMKLSQIVKLFKISLNFVWKLFRNKLLKLNTNKV